jgi:phosphoenolpyruvate-protein phosphotransferase
MTALVLAAPLAGWVTRLDEVPDPAFAQGLVGDGVAIDPISNELCAPCDGVVVSVHRAHHACTLLADCGAEILLHIGIDTVALRSEGFQTRVAGGQRVRTGDPLIAFDIDLVARRARSLHVPVLLVGGDGFAVVERVINREVTVGEFLLAIARSDARVAATATATGPAATRLVRLALSHGLHARPAAAFVRRARQHAGEVTVASRQRTASGKSVVALMALDARPGDELAITASGPGAEATVTELAVLVGAGPGDTRELDGARAGDAAAPAFVPGDEVALEGAAAAAGLAIGTAVRLADGGAADVARDGAGVAVEQAKLAAALSGVRRDIEQTVADAQARGDATTGEIFRAHLELIDDPELVDATARQLTAGRSAAWAWREAIRELAAMLRGLGNPLIAERAGDLTDLERRTLARLAERGGRLPVELPERAVLIADELLPSELAAAPAGRVAALCTARGGATSHVAILAAGLGIPAVVAAGDAALRVPDGAPVIVDGDRGQVRVFPAAVTLDATERAIASRAARRTGERARAQQPALTEDGVEIAVCANLGTTREAATAIEHGADGCGLLRTELLFLDRPTAPSEDEQAARYQAIADALHGRPLVIRTLDAGGDKPLPFLPQVREDNPALGVRGVRLLLRHPALLRTQLRAILRVAPAGVCRIMIPMIASLAELRAVRVILDEERRALGVAAPALGAMIEVPVAALGAEALAREAEFFSIGTNDLTQYALATDRADGGAAALALDPGVLRLISSTVRGARVRGRPVSVCGGAAADRQAVPILLGLGVRTLSVAPASIPEIKAVVRAISLVRCSEVAAAALDLESGDEVRALVASTWPALGAPTS